MSEQRKTASQIVIDRFLKKVDEIGAMPWQKPYTCYNAFNYFTKVPYRGINRIMLDFGEYLTANQINQYNKEHKEDYKFQKGIKWYPVIFFKEDSKPCTADEIVEHIENPDLSTEGYIGRDGYWSYYKIKDGFVKKRQILRYSMVAERKWFVNSNGETLPSRIETGEVEITLSDPKKVFDDYIERSGVELYTESTGVPCYIPALDRVELNKYSKSEKTWFSTAFHECAHSTGAAKRLNRIGITAKGRERTPQIYAVEECIAEITASLCCAECGIYDFETSNMKDFENNAAYVAEWKKRVKDFDKEFIYICSQADKAFNYIMGMEI